MGGVNVNYNFAIFNPKNSAEAKDANDMVFILAQEGVLGIEVTIPALASRCTLGNIDPQHSGGDVSLAAIEVAMEADINALPPSGAVFATVRADLDSVGAMAILEMATKAEFSIDRAMRGRIELVAKADKFARGGWPGPRLLPSRANPWDETSASAEASRPLAAMMAAVSDHRVPLVVRVTWMMEWLLTGMEPGIQERYGIGCDPDVDLLLVDGKTLESYRGQVERERMEMVGALETGAIKYYTRFAGKIAVVESTHRAATMVGYALAPVVVAFNASYRQGDGQPHRKFTICAFEAGKYADIKAALAELAMLEPGWAGSPTIGGSPQGKGSELTIDQVVEVVTNHINMALPRELLVRFLEDNGAQGVPPTSPLMEIQGLVDLGDTSDVVVKYGVAHKALKDYWTHGVPSKAAQELGALLGY